MTFNIRYDNPGDDANNWKFRKDFALNMIRDTKVDILGTQEVLNNQLLDLLAGLPNYTYVGVGRKDGKTAGEYSAIIYNKEKFTYYNGGTFWLSENPSAIGVKGWDAAIERIVTWAVLKELKTGKKLAFFNTHFDHIGPLARKESAKLLLAKVKDLANDLPSVITGDLNSTPDSEPIKIITDAANPEHLTDSRSISKITTGPMWTFHGFGTINLAERTIIDYVFIKNKVFVDEISVIFEMKDNLYLSDHNPVLAKIRF
jgi:endonuclease/exonuclease/phosphatase family metal-dependent hydrolase